MSFLKKKSTIAVVVVLLAVLIGSIGYVVYEQQQMKQQALQSKQADFQKNITYVQHRDPSYPGFGTAQFPQNRMITKETYEGLVRYEGSDPTLKPALATRWDISPDGKVYTFYLRQGVKFYPSGDPFNAKVVCANYDYAFGQVPNSISALYNFGGPDFVQYDKCVAVDDYTVQVYAKQPISWFMRPMAYMSVGAIQNPNFLNAHGGWPKTDKDLDPYMIWHQDVTGPYIIQEFKAGDHVILQRNPTYWMGWTGNLSKSPQTVNIRLVPDTSTRLLLVGRGDADMAFIDRSYLPELKQRIASEKLPLIIDESPGSTEMMIMPDHLTAPTNDLHIRKMFAYSFNYDTFINTIMKGFGNRLYSYVPKGEWGYQPDVPHYDFDMTKAAAELALASPEAQAMVKQGVNVAYQPGSSFIDRPGFLMWKSDLAKIGVNLVLQEVTNAGRYSLVRAGACGCLFDMAWSPDFPDPATHYNFLYKNFYATAWGTSSDAVWALMIKAAFESNPDQRLNAYKQIEQFAYDTVSHIKIASPVGGDDYNVRGSWVKGYNHLVIYDHEPIFYAIWKELPTSTSGAAIQAWVSQIINVWQRRPS